MDGLFFDSWVSRVYKDTGYFSFTDPWWLDLLESVGKFWNIIYHKKDPRLKKVNYSGEFESEEDEVGSQGEKVGFTR